MLSSAILAGASQQLRNMASIGGNLLQRTRCAYFYDIATPCNKREPGSGCSAIGGLNRMNAILGTSERLHRRASLRHVRGAGGAGGDGSRGGPARRARHRVRGLPPAARRHAAARHQSRARTSSSPRSSCRRGALRRTTRYLKIRDRLSYAFALVSVAVGLELEGGTIKEARFALGGVAHKPWRNAAGRSRAARPARRATRRSRRPPISLLRDAKGFGHNTFKIDLARRAIVRALSQAARGTPQSQSNKKIA